jgi:hypothetical protein
MQHVKDNVYTNLFILPVDINLFLKRNYNSSGRIRNLNTFTFNRMIYLASKLI